MSRLLESQNDRSSKNYFKYRGRLTCKGNNKTNLKCNRNCSRTKDSLNHRNIYSNTNRKLSRKQNGYKTIRSAKLVELQESSKYIILKSLERTI